MKAQDPQAERIRFGIELETTIPVTAGVEVGAYHNGRPVFTGRAHGTGTTVAAPVFLCHHWRAERDGSIRCEDGQIACEFVSPVLNGSEGIEHLLEFVAWATEIGAAVNSSCGCHITVGVESIIDSECPQAHAAYARKLAHIARWHAMSLYGQTGTGRHLSQYAHMLDDSVGRLVKRMEETPNPSRKAEAAIRCGRGMINFQKLFSHGVIEFRVFAGTLNRLKIMHHLATVLGLCRRAADVQCLGGFSRNKAQEKRTATAATALRFLWDYLGWTGSKRPVALGLIGPLHSRFHLHAETAQRMCAQFDRRFPNIRL